MGISPDQLTRTIEVLRQRFHGDPKRRSWNNARKMGFVRKGLRCGYGWKADLLVDQERESNELSAVSRREQAKARAAIEEQRHTQDLEDAKLYDQRRSYDDMEQRARRTLVGDDLLAMLARIDAARAKSGIQTSRAAGVVKTDDPTTPARDFSHPTAIDDREVDIASERARRAAQHKAIPEAKPAAAWALRIAGSEQEVA